RGDDAVEVPHPALEGDRSELAEQRRHDRDAEFIAKAANVVAHALGVALDESDPKVRVMAADVRLARNEGHQVGGRDAKLFRRGDEAIHLFRQRRRDSDRSALVLRRTDHDGPATTAALEDALT